MDVALFDFDLPKSSIALRPARPRDSARMLKVEGAGLEDLCVKDLAAALAPGDLLIFNDTKVIPSRLAGKRGDANMEITLHKREGATLWRAFARPAKKCKVGDMLTFGSIRARVEGEGRDGERLIAFEVAPEEMMESLSREGILPLPPYIASQRPVDGEDDEDYQTMFADKKGAVAAPTAGLHFTPAIMESLDARGVKTAAVTLHVGAGTFLPVKADNTDDHQMHAEYGVLSADVAARINETRASGGAVVAVGTTSLRLLESAVGADGKMRPFDGDTDIFITPGYQFKAVDVLMTNFHLPKSTLMMLVSAFAGLDDMMAAYKHAVEDGYRFYSYGDACLLFRKVDAL